MCNAADRCNVAVCLLCNTYQCHTNKCNGAVTVMLLLTDVLVILRH